MKALARGPGPPLRLAAATAAAAAVPILASAAAAAAPQAASGAFVAGPERALPLTPPGSRFDNVRGSWLELETSPVRPLLVDAAARRAVAVHPAALRLVVLDFPSLAPAFEVPVGPGPVAAVPRAGTDEVWVVDSVTHTVGVVDLGERALVRTIVLQGREPHGLVFHPSGDRAYVACSASGSVEVLRTADYRSVNAIDVPALQPRGIAFQDGKAWVAPWLSGNNTTAVGPQPLPNVIEFIVDLTPIPGVNQLPDRDLLGIVAMPDPRDDFLDPALTVTGLGTNLLNAHARPGTTEVWIPNTEALNDEIRGAANAVGGQVAENRVTVVDVATKVVTVVDLDETSLDGRSCAQPSFVAFDATGDTAYVVGYGSDLVARLDADDPGGGWTGYYEVPGRAGPDPGTPERSGPRGLAYDTATDALLVYNKGDASVSRIDLATTPALGGAAAAPVSLGPDPTTDEHRRGRLHLVNADHSLSGRSSCATCHVDGDLDGVVWDLSFYLDPEGTPPGSLAFPADVKGPMLTQRLRGLPVSGPYHWRGERGSLGEFNASVFVGLMDRPAPLPPADFADVETFLTTLVHRSNPRQVATRDYQGDAQLGYLIHTQQDVVQPAFPGATKCAVCHAHPLGTNGEVFRNNPSVNALSTVVPQMRGLQDRLGELYDVGSVVGPLRTEQGIGAMHNGGRGTIFTYQQSQDLFLLSTTQMNQVTAFLQEFDTGLAPATAWQRTVRAGSAERFLADAQGGLPYVRDQLAKGYCDLAVYARWIGGPTPEQLAGLHAPAGSGASGGADAAGGAPPPGQALAAGALLPGAPQSGGVTKLDGAGAHAVRLAYDHASGRLRLPFGDALVGIEELVALVVARGGELTFLGLPLGMGWRQGVDRDFDGLLDGAEAQRGTDPAARDTDGDGFEDGHEVAHGMDPLAPDLASPDVTPPALVASEVVFATVRAVEVELTTSEVCRATLSYGGASVSGPPLGVFDVNHSLVLAPLPAGTTFDADLTLTDGAGNVTVTTVELATAPRVVPLVSRVADIALSGYDAGLGEATVTVTVGDQLGGQLAGGATVEAFAYYEDDAMPLTTVVTGATATAAPDEAVFTLTLPAPGSPSGRTLHFGVTEVLSGLDYVLAEDVTSFESLTLTP